MNFYFMSAALLCLIIAGIHVFVGGPQLVRPLRSSTNLHPVVRETHYECWHFVSICLAAIAGQFFWAAFVPSAYEVAVVGTLTATAFCLWGLALVPCVGQRYRDMPQGFLFLPVAILGGLGLYL